MFDELGGVWPKHSCFDRQYQNLFKTVAPILKKGADPKSGMFKPFADLAKTFGFNIDEMESVSASKQRFSQKKKVSQPVKVEEHTIKRMDPIAGEVVSIVGVIRDRQTATSKIENIYAKLGQLGHKMFGLPPKTRAVHITVIDNEGEPNESYTCIGDAQLLGKSLTLGVMVWVRLEAKVTPSVSAWVIAEIHAI